MAFGRVRPATCRVRLDRLTNRALTVLLQNHGERLCTMAGSQCQEILFFYCWKNGHSYIACVLLNVYGHYLCISLYFWLIELRIDLQKMWNWNFVCMELNFTPTKFNSTQTKFNFYQKENSISIFLKSIWNIHEIAGLPQTLSSSSATSCILKY